MPNSSPEFKVVLDREMYSFTLYHELHVMTLLQCFITYVATDLQYDGDKDI